MKKFIILLFITAGLYQSAIAGVCDYTPSKLVGAVSSGVFGVGAGTTAATGIGMKAAGIYTLTHSTTGALMLGSTASGASAAGTTGIIAGTGGMLGSIGALIMSPFVIIPAVIVAAGVGAYEGGCYLTSK